MRWLFVLLLVTNLVYLGWELDREAGIEIQKSMPVRMIPSSAQRLQLLSETQELPELREQGNTERIEVFPDSPTAELVRMDELVSELPDIQLADARETLDPSSCFRLGPLADEALAGELYQWFHSRDALPRIQYTEEPGARLFWIYLAPQVSREDALAVLDEMQSKGIGDYRLINRGDLENAISLGVFSSREAVDARLAELEAKGYVPVVVPYTDIKQVYWLHVEVVDNTAVAEEMWQADPARYDPIPVNCDVSGDNSPEAL
ncbi:MAG: SPOR domain-containing protein [Gammaproteobacteria bacterium]